MRSDRTIHTIVVGIDGSNRSRAALRWAADRARTVGGDVCAVEVRPPESEFVPATSLCLNPYGGPPRSYHDALADLVGEVQAEEHQSIAAHRVFGRTGRALAEAARGADLLVVGAHRGHVLTGLGAFVEDCLRHSTCPVVIIPESPSHKGES